MAYTDRLHQLHDPLFAAQLLAGVRSISRLPVGPLLVAICPVVEVDDSVSTTCLFPLGRVLAFFGQKCVDERVESPGLTGRLRMNSRL